MILNKVPEWALWVAVDANGDAFYYEYKPTLLASEWVEPSKDGRVLCAGRFDPFPNWEDSCTNLADLRKEIDEQAAQPRP